MNRILTKTQLSEKVFLLDVEAPEIAAVRKAGQFVIVQMDDEFGERIPLTIADASEERGTITLIVQVVGGTTAKLARLRVGEPIRHLLGPLGTPTHVEKFGTVVCVAGGIGAAPLYPIAKALKEAGNRLFIIHGARTERLLILEKKLRPLADYYIRVTDDGSAGRQALVTEPLADLCQCRKAPDRVIAVGPPVMMKHCAETTRARGIPTVVSLNTIMVDATGMCGGCRVMMGDQAKFVCVDGPEFDGHLVDFDNMIQRLDSYREQEAERAEETHAVGTCVAPKRREPWENPGDPVQPREIPHNRDRLNLSALKLLQQFNGNSMHLKPKERRAIPRQDMPELDPVARSRTMEQVALGYTEDQARLEALRCLQCPNKNCVEGCPVGLDIPAFVRAIAEGDFKKGIEIIRRHSLLPAVCGRVCPQEQQCQAHCTLGRSLKDVNQAVSIGRLERFLADWEREHPEERVLPEIKPDTGRKVAVVGSGPSSITVAADVRREGHAVTIFEAFHKPGGVLLYGIPEFRLPKKIVEEEIQRLEEMGVEIRTNYVVGRTRTLKDLLEKDGYDAIFLGTGAGLPRFLEIPGENLVGVFSANEYLTRTNLMRAYDRGQADTPIYASRSVAVIGGGNVAMDAARMALRLGAGEVRLIYRRTLEEMPARREEVEHAEAEGVRFELLQSPVRVLGDDNGRVNGLECQHYELGEPDETGRRRPVVKPGESSVYDVDTVIVAIGNESNPLIRQTTEGLATNENGNLIVDEEGRTTLDRVFAGGDIVLGAATVIMAMGEGRRAAAGINKMLAAPDC